MSTSRRLPTTYRLPMKPGMLVLLLALSVLWLLAIPVGWALGSAYAKVWLACVLGLCLLLVVGLYRAVSDSWARVAERHRGT